MLEPTIRKLIVYAKEKMHLSSIDAIYVQNQLLDLFHLSAIECENIDVEEIKLMKVPDALMEELLQDIHQWNPSLSDMECSLLLTKVMGLLTPMPSTVIERFERLEKENPQLALQDLYDLQIANNYIQKTAVDKNLYWKTENQHPDLEITINLSKPEKKNADIAKLVQNEATNVQYPKCMLCIENVGYAGRSNHPARQNIRVIPLRLGQEEWFLQFSPYVYYQQHCIAVCSHHEPMQMGRRIFACLADFVQRFPCYFIGSNSELPIVGGSILNHEHFQGGAHRMPIMDAEDDVFISLPHFSHCKVSFLKWHNSAIRIVSSQVEELLDCADFIFQTWRNYRDEEAEIIPNSGNTQHSTVTPIMRKENEHWILDLILRNNRCNENYPEGIFHAHREHHHIKSEGIGLIEAMGMFILPARLQRQTQELIDLLTSQEDIESYFEKHADLGIHRAMFDACLKQKKRPLSKEDAQREIRQSINETCRLILENTAVFKKTVEGKQHRKRFIQHIIKKEEKR